MFGPPAFVYLRSRASTAIATAPTAPTPPRNGVVQPKDGIYLHQQSASRSWSPARWQGNRVCSSVAWRGRERSHHGTHHQPGARSNIKARCMCLGVYRNNDCHADIDRSSAIRSTVSLSPPPFARCARKTHARPSPSKSFKIGTTTLRASFLSRSHKSAPLGPPSEPLNRQLEVCGKRCYD